MRDEEIRRRMQAYGHEVRGPLRPGPSPETLEQRGLLRLKRLIIGIAVVVVVALLAVVVFAAVHGGSGAPAHVSSHAGAYTEAMAWVWLVGAVLLVAVEVFTLAFFALFVAIGMLGGAIAAALGAPVLLQALVVAAVAVLGLAAARPPLQRALHRRPNHPAIGSQGRLGHGPVGQEAMTIDRVGDSHHPGHVLYAGERWLAVTEVPEGLPPNVPVTILEVKGTTLVVWP